jgi:hypothetical protein
MLLHGLISLPVTGQTTVCMLDQLGCWVPFAYLHRFQPHQGDHQRSEVLRQRVHTLQNLEREEPWRRVLRQPAMREGVLGTVRPGLSSAGALPGSAVI